ncbi:TetR/AcrR family transcriptional regulator [Gilvimarinus algae]|uniref:TetR/AcrR family transcriptional regulator n=1 Tax=Gilvimarinus algae TaxID=3058037 RepID=A0ABT8TJR6_9GAMM|nr:TetR/AcrR family transcriptional regulator [Gilvimarinus sp. SDUM040014]MDO3383338.1 TetR/AcrR family transcriptional regulator [Gilvimarinus sp. SDUM040014]
MGWKSEHKQQTKARILSAAGQLFTRLGYERVSIDDVMAAAGLTRGAFYAHFGSKSELYAEAIVTAAIRARNLLLEPLSESPSVDAIAARYLSPERARDGDARCPLAFLATDIHQRDDQVRDAYTRVLKGFARTLAGNTTAVELSPQTLRQLVLLVGGLALARAVNDPALSQCLLDACRQGVNG